MKEGAMPEALAFARSSALASRMISLRISISRAMETRAACLRSAEAIDSGCAAARALRPICSIRSRTLSLGWSSMGLFLALRHPVRGHDEIIAVDHGGAA